MNERMKKKPLKKTSRSFFWTYGLQFGSVNHIRLPSCLRAMCWSGFCSCIYHACYEYEFVFDDARVGHKTTSFSVNLIPVANLVFLRQSFIDFRILIQVRILSANIIFFCQLPPVELK